ncbi:hypothetical protein [Gracilimonas halophila]|uniref:DUF4410 domain-containing protein n=1 Tax=Gracilimonas halophila TaxID=1834464 RepID=A0ABW5JI78_9BACT
MLSKNITFILFALILTSCVTTSNIPTEVSSEIPDDANAIELYSTESPSDFYKTIYQHLASEGFSISQENSEMGTFSTGFKEVGQETTLKIDVFVEKDNNGSKATLRGSWNVTSSMGAGITAATGASLGGTSAERASWDQSGRPKVAFGEMAVIAKEIEYQKLEYISD